MTARVYGLSGKTILVATTEDGQSGGGYDLPKATISTIGGVKQCPPIDDVQTIPVTDIESAQLAIAAMGTTISELIQDLRAAGIIAR